MKLTACIFIIIILLIGLSISIYFAVTNVSTSSQTLKTLKTVNDPRYFLSLIVIAKNEEDIIQEFCQHYLDQGIDHIYLIDNGSTDSMVDKLSHFVNIGCVTIFSLNQPHQQANHYNTVYQQIRAYSLWVLVVDVDEYFYGVSQPLKNVLQKNMNEYDYIAVHSVNFGSNGHVEQPKSIRTLFTLRSSSESMVKALFRTKYVYKLDVHEHLTQDGADIRRIEIHMLDPLIRANHYQILSWDYYQKVKMTRGDAVNTNNDRNYDTFHELDKVCTIEDLTLSNIVEYGYK